MLAIAFLSFCQYLKSNDVSRFKGTLGLTSSFNSGPSASQGWTGRDLLPPRAKRVAMSTVQLRIPTQEFGDGDVRQTTTDRRLLLRSGEYCSSSSGAVLSAL